MRQSIEIAKEIVNQYDGNWQVIKERGELASLIAAAIEQERLHQAKLEAELATWKEKHFNDTMAAKKSGYDEGVAYHQQQLAQLQAAGGYLARRLARVSGGSDQEALDLWTDTLKKLMGRA